MPWIQNISRSACTKGDHYASDNCMLIQIQDPPGDLVKPAWKFQQIRQYDFLDLQEGNEEWDEFKDFAISPEQADSIANDLKYALEHGMDVVVHCHAGVCRSGAVAEVGTMIGFTDTGSHRIPNVRVKRLLMQKLGIGYD